MKRLLFLTMLSLTGLDAAAQDAKAVKIVLENTSMAISGEEAYKAQAKEINKQKTKTVAQSSVRYLMKMADKNSRERMVFSRNSAAYRRLVRECANFSVALGRLTTEVFNHPVNSLNCMTEATNLLYEAQGLVKEAVTVGMNNQVPLPWKVSIQDLETGRWFPNYQIDGDRKTDEVDGYNLLLPDERYQIVNRAIYRLQDMTRMMNVIIMKLKVQFTLRGALIKALPYDYYWALGMKSSFTKLMSDIKHFPMPGSTGWNGLN